MSTVFVPPVTGDLWMPHVYMPAQLPKARQPAASTRSAAGCMAPGSTRPPPLPMGRSPTRIMIRTAAAPIRLYLPQCETPGQPPLIPGTPNVSMGMEAFQDSVVVNGTAFPTLTVDPKPYRFRILNAASDRFQNLSFYVADSGSVSVLIHA